MILDDEYRRWLCWVLTLYKRGQAYEGESEDGTHGVFGLLGSCIGERERRIELIVEVAK